MVSKLFKHMGFISKQHPDYKSFQGLISTMFQGLVERKISPAMVYHWLTHQVYWSLCQYEYNKELDVLTDVILLYREFNPATKPPYENVRGPFLHMPELYEKEHLLNQLEMKCSDIVSGHCFCLFHADFPMKFGEAHRYMSFRMYKILHEDNLPVGEVVTQQNCIKALSTLV